MLSRPPLPESVNCSSNAQFGEIAAPYIFETQEAELLPKLLQAHLKT
ncbi:hypothetical protein HanPSC8_Chr15g0657881 [Helianthus annuus]|nr:hypothetical protein HanPSC8_Chr15g0657881 [Helianthus annuus]